MPDPAALFRLADRLGAVRTGSRLADEAIHRALGLTGDPPPYTTDETAAEGLLPAGYVVEIRTDIPGQVPGVWLHYAACRDARDPAYPHHGQWGSTKPLAKCGAVLRCIGARAG
jgi:hypothetical protein